VKYEGIAHEQDAAEMEDAVAAFARSSNGGLIVTAGAAAIVGLKGSLRHS